MRVPGTGARRGALEAGEPSNGPPPPRGWTTAARALGTVRRDLHAPLHRQWARGARIGVGIEAGGERARAGRDEAPGPGRPDQTS